MANINWQNLPSETTPINSTNLNVMSAGLLNVSNEVDDTYRVNLLYSKNLFDKNNASIISGYAAGSIITSNSNMNSIYIPCKPNTTYTVSKIASSRFKVSLTNSSTTPTIGTSVSDDIQNNDATKITITTKNDTTYIIVWFYYSTDDTLTSQEILDTIQIEEGSTATTYSPFVSNQIVVDNEKYSDTLNVGASLDSRSRVNVLKSKNLFDKDNVNKINAYLPSSTGGIGSNASAITIYIPCEKNTIYTISKGVSDRFIVGTTINVPAVGVESTFIVRDDSATLKTITTGNNANYLCIYYSASNQNIDNTIIIEKGSSIITPSIYVDNEEIYTKPEIVELLSDTTITASTSYTLNDAITNYKYIMIVLTSANLFQNSRREYIPVEQIKAYSTDYRIGISVFQTTSVYMFADLYFSSATQIYCNGKTQGSTGWSPHLKVYGIK